MFRKGRKDAIKDKVWYDVVITVYFTDQQKPLVIKYAHAPDAGGAYWESFIAGKVFMKIAGYQEAHLVNCDIIRRMKLQRKRRDGVDE